MIKSNKQNNIQSFGTLDNVLNFHGDYRQLLPAKKMVNQNQFLSAVVYAYLNHYPLILKPDHIWQLIVMAVAQHFQHKKKELRIKITGKNEFGKKSLFVHTGEKIGKIL